MKHIQIKNNGLIEPQALYLLGASTKRNDSSKIGQFGSGNKYAIAYLLRNGYEIKVFSGLNEIKIETKEEVFRENKFQVLYINGERTSITTDTGTVGWNNIWMCLRELISNSMDEGGYEMNFVNTIQPAENQTHFYIQNKSDTREFVINYDNYFSTNKEVLFECEAGQILKKTGDKINIYRKGIRCFDTNKNGIFDYSFSEIEIDENRMVKYNWKINEKMWDLIFRCDKEDIIMQILHNCGNDQFMEGCVEEYSSVHAGNMSEVYLKCIKKVRLAPRGRAGLLKQDELDSHIIIPTKIFQTVRGVIGDENVGDKFKVNKDGAIFREIELTNLHKATLKEVMYFFKEVKFDIPYEIKIAIFEDKEVAGCAYKKVIYISDICMDRGVNDVVNTIIEEFIHIKYKAGDETRAFQTAMITEFIAYMKKCNSIVI